MENITEALSTEIAIPEPYNTKVDALMEGSGLPKDRVLSIKAKFADAFEKISDWELQANAIVVQDENDKKSMAEASKLRKEIKKVRTGTENKKKEGVSFLKSEQKIWENIFSLIESSLKPIEALLTDKEKSGERAENLKQQQTYNDRKELLEMWGYPIAGLALGAMSEDDFSLHLDKAMETGNVASDTSDEPATELAVPDFSFDFSQVDKAFSEGQKLEVLNEYGDGPDHQKLRIFQKIIKAISYPAVESSEAASLITECKGYLEDVAERIGEVAYRLEVEAINENPPAPMPETGPDAFEAGFTVGVDVAVGKDQTVVTPLENLLNPEMVVDTEKQNVYLNGEALFPENEPETDWRDELANTSQHLTLEKLANEAGQDIEEVCQDVCGVTFAEITKRMYKDVEDRLAELAKEDAVVVPESNDERTDDGPDAYHNDPTIIGTMADPVNVSDDEDDEEFDLSKPWTLPPDHPNYVDYTGVEAKDLPEDHPRYAPF